MTPQGLTYYSNVITSEEETKLLAWLETKPWSPGPGGRRVQHYGYAYDYTTKTLQPAPVIPEPLQHLATQLVEKKVLSKIPAQIIVNEYLPGQGIGPHIDHTKWFGEEVASLSLQSATTMQFARASDKIELRLDPRSLLVLVFHLA
jgi:alkylated DNA repair dioxygenase AlkB